MNRETFRSHSSRTPSLIGDPFDQVATTTPLDSAYLLERERTQRAMQAFKNRRRRVAVFGAEMFGEPAWDVLLVLYIDRHSRRHSIGSVTTLTGAAPTTVLRWLYYLSDHNMIERDEDPRDGRMVTVSLSSKAIDKLDAYFSEPNIEKR